MYRVEANIEVLTEEGFLVEEKLHRLITPAEAAVISRNDGTDPRVYNLGPSIVLLLRKKNAFASLARIQHDLDYVYFSKEFYTALRDKEMFFPSGAGLERTLVLIKPDYKPEEYAAILQAIDANDFVVIGKVAQIIPTDTANIMFNGNKDDVDYVTSDVCVVLMIERVNAISAWQLIMGPQNPQLAREVAPNSIRAALGRDIIYNGVYGSPDAVRAKVDADLLFPVPFPIDNTLCLIKPNAMQYSKQILDVIKANNFTITAQQTLTMSKQRAEELFAHKYSSSSSVNDELEQVSLFMSSGPCLALVLSKPGAVDAWSKLIGPTDPRIARIEKPASLRALYGIDAIRNGLEGSESALAAEEAINVHFPNLTVEHIPNLQEVKAVLRSKAESDKSLHDVLLDGLTQLCHVKPVGLEAVRYLAEWLLRNNPNQPDVVVPDELTSLQAAEQEAESKGETLTLRERIKIEMAPDADSDSDNEDESDGASVSSAEIKVVMVIGAPGADMEDQCQLLANDSTQVEVISATTMLEQAVKAADLQSAMIRSYTESGRPVPTHLIISLLQRAMVNTQLALAQNKQSKRAPKQVMFVIVDFPKSLDHAFMFEEKVGSIDHVLYFDASEDTIVRQMMSKLETRAGMGGNDAASLVAAGLKNSREELLPVVEHYERFGRLSTVSCEGSKRDVVHRVKEAFKAIIL